MKYAVISDVHANETALRRVLADAAAHGADTVVCLGDVVGYGPLPKETIALVRRSAALTLAGNHDDAVSGRQGADGFIDLAGEAVKRHRKTLGADELEWLRRRPYECRLEGAIAAHGDFTDPKAFNYIDNESSAAANFNATDAQLMFVGHTHVPGIFVVGQSGNIHHLDPLDFSLEPDKRYIVNPGSVGYPRETNGACYSSYVLYDVATRSVYFRLLPFSVGSVMQRGTAPRRAGLVAAAAAIAIAAIAGALILHSAKPAKVMTVTVEVPAEESRELVLQEKSLPLKRDHTYVQANLKIAKGKDDVRLVIRFEGAGGKALSTFEKTVKGSSKDRIKIPPDAISAHFTILKPTPAAQPKVVSFAPSAK